MPLHKLINQLINEKNRPSLLRRSPSPTNHQDRSSPSVGSLLPPQGDQGRCSWPAVSSRLCWGGEHSAQVTSFVQPGSKSTAESGNITRALPQCFWITSGTPGSDTEHPCPPPSAHLPSTGGSSMPLPGQCSFSPSAHPKNPSCQAGPSSGSCFYSKLPEQQQIINTQGTAVPQSFPDIWFYLQSETLDLNLGMEQEVRFQSSKINPLGGSIEARFLSLVYSLKADGSRESVLSSKPLFVEP